MSENITEIAIAIITLLGIVLGGAIYSKKKSKKKTQRNTQENITINGDDNKVVGGNDNSKS